jgi:hypothetical protein
MHPSRGSNPNAFVPNSGGLPREAANRRSQQRREQGNPITHTFEIDTGYFHCQEHRYFYPYSNYEVVQIQTTDRNASIPRDTFYILNFPIDQLSEHLVEKAIQLNPRRIALCNPLSSEVFNNVNNHNHILEMTLKILCNIDSLTKITLCVDILNHELFWTLKNQSHLREVEILQPSSTFPDGLVGIGTVLNQGVKLLKQVKDFKVPLQIVNSYPATVDYLTPVP